MKSYSTVVLLVTVMVANAYCMHSRNEDIPDSELLMEKALSLLEGEKTMAEINSEDADEQKQNDGNDGSSLFCVATSGGFQRYCYTKWLDRDNPSATGDWEPLRSFPASQVCPRPIGIECQTVTGQDYKSTGNVFFIDCDQRKGLVCKNSDQPGGKQCKDYRVRFLCPEGTIKDTKGIQCQEFCETPFYDRDNPSGKCDCEQLSLGPYSGPTPVGIRCIDRATGKDHQDICQKMTCKPDFGGQCVNADNPGDPCKDYMVQYIHPCKKNITLSLPINVPAAKAETEADLDLLDKLFSLDNERE